MENNNEIEINSSSDSEHSDFCSENSANMSSSESENSEVHSERCINKKKFGEPIREIEIYKQRHKITPEKLEKAKIEYGYESDSDVSILNGQEKDYSYMQAIDKSTTFKIKISKILEEEKEEKEEEEEKVMHKSKLKIFKGRAGNRFLISEKNQSLKDTLSTESDIEDHPVSKKQKIN